jgi:zinc protease
LGRSPTEATLTAVGRDDLLAFHGRYFHPGNVWLAISGDFDRIRLLTLLLENFGDWPAVTFEAQAVPAVTTPQRAVLLLADRDLPQTVIRFGELGIDKSAPDLEAVRVMNYILGGGGFNSRLMREVRSNRGLAYSVHSYFQVGRRLPGPFIAQSETKSASTLEVVGLMRQLMEAMRNSPVAEDELRLAQESLINSFVFAFNDSHEVVSQALRLDFYGYPPDYLSGYRARVAAVTPAAVQQAARDRLHPEKMTLVLVGREKDFAAPAATLGLPVEPILP